MKPLSLTALATSLILSTVSAQAGTMGTINDFETCNWFASIAGGPVWAQAGETQTFFLASGIEKTYQASKSALYTMGTGELFLGLQNAFNPDWLAQYGVEGSITSYTQLSGHIWDDALPQFDNYRYQYQIENARVLAKGKLFLYRPYSVIPWISGGIGVSFNRAYNFNSEPLIFEALPSPNFTNNTTTSFAYTVGAGIQKELNEHIQYGIGYEFADWGKSALGNASGQTMNSGLKLNHLYTNGLLINFTYVS